MSDHPGKPHGFNDTERHGVYRAIFERRDVRAQFRADPIPDEVLARLLVAAHHAPSVGFMQPWDFVLVSDRAVRQRVKEAFDRENARAASLHEGERGVLYRSLKLEGILETPLNLCITCDRGRGGPHVLGRNSMLDTDLFSTCLAVQNLWLAARAEGVGVGWVSIIDPAELATLLGLPSQLYPLAYLCLGYVDEFLAEPELARAGWRQRLDLGGLVHRDRWGALENDDPILQAISRADVTNSLK